MRKTKRKKSMPRRRLFVKYIFTCVWVRCKWLCCVNHGIAIKNRSGLDSLILWCFIAGCSVLLMRVLPVSRRPSTLIRLHEECLLMVLSISICSLIVVSHSIRRRTRFENILSIYLHQLLYVICNDSIVHLVLYCTYCTYSLSYYTLRILIVTRYPTAQFGAVKYCTTILWGS